MGYIYCITSPSGKKYIGQTSRNFKKRKLALEYLNNTNAVQRLNGDGSESHTINVIKA